MKKIFLPLITASLLIWGVASAPAATADPYCTSFSLYSYCVEAPSYTTPPPTPQATIPKWVCTTVSVTSIVFAWLPVTSPATIVARFLTVPSTYCALV